MREIQAAPGLGEPEALSSLRRTPLSSPGSVDLVSCALAAPCCLSDRFLVTPQARLIQKAAPDTPPHLCCAEGSPVRQLRAQVSKSGSQYFRSHPGARLTFSALFLPLIGDNRRRETICFVSYCEAHVIKISKYM